MTGDRADHDRVLRRSRAWIEGDEEALAIQYRLRHKDGSFRHVDSRARKFRDAAGRSLRLLGCHIDVTHRVREEQERLQIFERITDGFVALDREWRYTYVNSKASEMTGRPAVSLIGRNIWDEFPDAARALRRQFEEAVLNQSPRIIEHFSTRLQTWFEFHVYPSAEGVSFYAHDVSERRKASEALRASEQRLRNLIDGLGPSMFVGMLTPDGIVVEVNVPVLVAAKVTRGQVLGRKFDELECWTHASEVQARVRDAIERARRGKSSRFDVVARVGPDQYIVIDFSLQPVFDDSGSVSCTIPSARVITDRKRAEDALQETNERMRALSNRLVSIQEKERRDLARELHDEIGQELTAIKIGLETLRRFPKSRTSTIDNEIALVDQTLQQVRALSLQLRPPMLDDLGLGPSLRWLVDQQRRVSDTQIIFHDALQRRRFDPAIEIACFRVAQEALTNVARHARAETAMAQVEERDGCVHLVVSDDGAGFDVAAALERASRGDSLGLLSMRERAMLTGGTITWTSEPGVHTLVDAWFPCHRAMRSDE